MSFGYLAKRGYYASNAALKEVDSMAAIGVDSVALMVSVMQDTFHSTTLYQDFEFTVSDQELIRIIERLHEKGIRVMLKPMVECHDSSWRGNINFPDDNQQIQGRVTNYWNPWFESLQRSVEHYARIAESTACEFYCIGCELYGAEQAIHNQRWSRIIDATRAIFTGQICYDAQPPTLLDLPEPPQWMCQLDTICLSYYTNAAARAGATTQEMIEHMRPTVAKLRSVSRQLGLPIIFGETGCRSMEGAAINPAEYRTSGAYSGEEQSRFLEAMCTVFWEEPWWGGFYWWKWDEQQHRPHYHLHPEGDTGFSLKGKPAADIFKKWSIKRTSSHSDLRNASFEDTSDNIQIEVF